MPGIDSEQMVLFAKDMYPVANEAYKEKPLQFTEIFNMPKDRATGSGDKHTQLLGADKLREKTVQGQGFQFRSPVQGWQTLVCYKTFFDAVEFDKEEVEDNVKNGVIGKTLKNYASTWGAAIRTTKEEFAAKFFNWGGLTSGNAIFNGTWGDNSDSSGDLVYDSKPLFNVSGNERTAKDGSTYYNAMTSTDLNPTNFGTLYDLMAKTNAYTEVGTKMENKPDMLLTEDGSDYRKALRILKSEKLPNGQLNDMNPYEGLCRAFAWSYLSGGAWYVLKAKDPSLCWENRQDPVFDFFRDKNNRSYKATVDVRFGVHIKPGCWKRIARNGGSYAANVAAM